MAVKETTIYTCDYCGIKSEHSGFKPDDKDESGRYGIIIRGSSDAYDRGVAVGAVDSADISKDCCYNCWDVIKRHYLAALEEIQSGGES